MNRATNQGLYHLGHEILRVEEEQERGDAGKSRRAELETRRKALRWALHVLLTGDPTEPPGRAVERFLWALKGPDDPTPR